MTARPGTPSSAPTPTPKIAGSFIKAGAYRSFTSRVRAISAAVKRNSGCAPEENQLHGMGCGAPPTMVGTTLLLSGNAASTLWIGLATVLVLLPANSKPTTSALFEFTTREPESPAELKAPPPTTNLLVKETLNVFPVPQPFSYCTVVFTCTAWMLAQLRPVVRPLLATGMPTTGAKVVLAGAAERGGLPPAASNCRMAPPGSICPGKTCAMAASTLLVLSGAA